MKALILTLLVFVSSVAEAAHVNCYSAGKLIYSGNAKSVFYDDRTLVIHRGKNKQDVFIFADCVVRI